jgi:hypothetical protein
MADEGALALKGGATLVAAVLALVLVVQLAVLGEVRRLGESLVAYLALEGLLAGVGAQVVGWWWRSVLAGPTRKMGRVLTIRALGLEPLSAPSPLALVRHFARVGALMLDQRLLRRQPDGTSRVWALEWFD